MSEQKIRLWERAKKEGILYVKVMYKGFCLCDYLTDSEWERIKYEL